MPPSGTCRSDGIAECSSHQLSVPLIPVNFSARMSQLGLPSKFVSQVAGTVVAG
jgi:hypothetical protein